MQREIDANGKLDLEEASAAAVAGAGLTMQDKSKAAMERVKNTLDKTENVAVDIKFQLNEQNEKLMIIDSKLQDVEKLSVRFKGMTKRLRKGI